MTANGAQQKLIWVLGGFRFCPTAAVRDATQERFIRVGTGPSRNVSRTARTRRKQASTGGSMKQ